MPLRMSGLISGMDTEYIVQELMKAQRLKSTRIENSKTKLEWKQDKWKDLNTKVYSFYTGSLSKLRMQGNYSTKRVTASNNDKIDIKANINAPEGSHSIQVKQMASAQFVTGGRIESDNNGKAVTTATRLTDIGFSASEGTTIKIESGNRTVNLDIGATTTVGDFTEALKRAGLNASFDVSQKRFFISSKESGSQNSFSITSSSSEQAQDRNLIRNFLSYGTLTTTQKTNVDNRLNTYLTDTTEQKNATRDYLLNLKHSQVRAGFIKAYREDPTNIEAVTEAERARLEAELEDGEELDESVLKKAVNAKLLADAEAAVAMEYEAYQSGTANAFYNAEAELNSLLASYETDSGTSIVQNNNLSLLKLSEIERTTDELGNISVSAGAGVALVQASDAKVIYNGAELISASNTIMANGLTFTVKGITAEDEIISINVIKDTQAVYDMINDFVKNYNELLKEMNGAFMADNAKGFEPLTDEQKQAMTEKQIEKWEDKIRNSLLRRDSQVGSLLASMRTNLSKSVNVNGKAYSLSSFGITTGPYTERGLLHINGDPEDALFSFRENSLMKNLEEDPETVMKVLSGLAGELYKDLTSKMKGSSLSSALTLYNDKEMKSTISNYDKDLKKLETKLNEMENRYFKQFTAMEKAMASLNTQTASLMSMLGMNSNQRQ